jgi:hypothetical protein
MNEFAALCGKNYFRRCMVCCAKNKILVLAPIARACFLSEMKIIIFQNFDMKS